jgi:hypothetical protein
MPKRTLLVFIVLAAIGLLSALAPKLLPPGATDIPATLAVHTDLPANQWVRLSSTRESALGWTLQTHSAIAYDAKRGTIFVFGSDTHGENWDNAVHEFNPATLAWTTHGQPAPFESYRADSFGQAVSGPPERPAPWAMHTYDQMVYDPRLDGLVVVAVDSHNYPAHRTVKGVKYHPTWFYSAATDEWRTLLNQGAADPRAVPTFFASAASYDPDRDVIWAFKKDQLWYLDEDRKSWKQVSFTGKNRIPALSIHFTMVYDTQRHNLALFGNYENTRKVVIYHPGLLPAEPGTWEVRSPGGDAYPEDSQVPAAFDQKQGVFLLLPEETTAEGPLPATLLYDPRGNRYVRIADARAPKLMHGLHYLLAFDRGRGMFLLVTRSDDSGGAVDVWAFRLDYSRLNPAAP